MTVRTVLHNGLLCVLAIVVTIGLLEISVRAYQSLRWSTSFWGTFGGPDQTDEILGWRPKPFHSFDMDTVDHSGTPYNVQYRSYEHGFREWQDDRDEALRILFIGDSYTRAKSVSNDKTYYNIVAQNHPIEVFAFGDSGYGTLQEYMILDQYFREINPDLIILQFTPNDFFDNDPNLSRRFGGAIMGTRPYLIGGIIETRIRSLRCIVRYMRRQK